MPFQVAIVSRDAAVRTAAARAFAAAPPEWSVSLLEDDPVAADVLVRGSDLDAGDAVAFHPERPDEAVRAVGAAMARLSASPLYVVVGATGGAGTTSLALHLAAEWGAGTCYAEVAAAGATARLGLPEDARTWSSRDDDAAASMLPVAGGFRVLLCPRPAPGAESFPLTAARAATSRLVLDAATDRRLAPVLGEATAGVLVTTPTRPGALAARSVLEEFPETRWAVVVNRLGPGGQIMPAALEALLGRRTSVELPCCPALRDAEDEGRLVSGGWRRWRRGVTLLARALSRC